MTFPRSGADKYLFPHVIWLGIVDNWTDSQNRKGIPVKTYIIIYEYVMSRIWRAGLVGSVNRLSFRFARESMVCIECFAMLIHRMNIPSACEYEFYAFPKRISQLLVFVSHMAISVRRCAAWISVQWNTNPSNVLCVHSFIHSFHLFWSYRIQRAPHLCAVHAPCAFIRSRPWTDNNHDSTHGRATSISIVTSNLYFKFSSFVAYAAYAFDTLGRCVRSDDKIILIKDCDWST